MNELTKKMGKRLRIYRLRIGLSQEKTAELAECHPTYIGQIERGEKNATLESIARITKALGIQLSQLFDKIEDNVESRPDTDIPSKCYEFLLEKNSAEQKQIYKIILELDKYMQMK